MKKTYTLYKITNGSNLLTLEAGSDLPLNAYFLGDVNGDYANQIT